MRRFLGICLMVAMAAPLAFGAAALAQSSDARLVGSWSGQVGMDKLEIVFSADGTAKIIYQGDSGAGTYTADFGSSPGILTLQPASGGGAALQALIEFVDDNHVRMSEPSAELPASMAAGSPVIFERVAPSP